MPMYEYQCSCGFRDEKLWPTVSRAKPTIPCSECGGEMEKRQTAASFKFKHSESQLRGMAPPNTGTSDDWKFDRIIGRDAEKKWGIIEKRNEVKDGTIRDERQAGRLVKREHLVPKFDGSGEYRVITEPERVKANANRKAAFDIAQAAKKQKSE